jgi:CBS domain-containing protein
MFDSVRVQIAAARDLPDLVTAAATIPRTAAAVLSMADATVAVGEVTQHLGVLNDEVTRRVVQVVADERGIDLRQACWLAFGSQARAEPTLLTDQDNGLVFAAATDDEAQAQRPRWLAYAGHVNEALARCGYPLCTGLVMAGQPLCCLSPGEWQRRFSHWLAHGDGNDLFAARLYFDLRPVAGNDVLAQPLVDLLRSSAAAVPRFIKQLAGMVLAKPVPLNWLGRVVTSKQGGRAMFDLKLNGSGLFVDAARLWALAHRLAEVGTAARLRAAARVLHVPGDEAQAWVAAFEALQGLRLRRQCRQGPYGPAGLHGQEATSAATADLHHRAWVPWQEFDAADRQELKQALRAAQLVQQRIELDYCR